MIIEKMFKVGLNEFLGNKVLRDLIQEKLESKGNRNLLDLGSGLPYLSTMYFHFFDLDEIYLIDKRSEKECIERAKITSKIEANDKILNSSSEFWNWYNKLCNQGLLYTDWNKDLPHSEFINNRDEYYNKFKLFLNKDILDFLNENETQKFNIIFLNHILHLLEINEIKKILHIVKERVNSEKGMIFIRYQTFTVDEKAQKFQSLLFEIFDKGTIFYFNEGLFFTNLEYS